MKSKIIAGIIIWLVIATATAASVAYINYEKKMDSSFELAAKVDIDEVEAGNDKVQKNNIIDSPLRSKEEILIDLDRGMDNIIFDEK
ncbi:hypothetical protein HN784_01565 [bacterium]|mgnify:CR=1 FL=1|jgi:hypothetical protein|nr:hypothetical protein [bacterium]MBT4250950.1 hypothetical protein [bacterium]MBT4597862.1 hypothetical protein [bacterium]MBT6753946.1 hypothetical protein [bacterium]MBT7037375.1 hypothetical protein [bacterium]